jgi:hypothetical protein
MLLSGRIGHDRHDSPDLQRRARRCRACRVRTIQIENHAPHRCTATCARRVMGVAPILAPHAVKPNTNSYCTYDPCYCILTETVDSSTRLQWSKRQQSTHLVKKAHNHTCTSPTTALQGLWCRGCYCSQPQCAYHSRDSV